ncbi:uncharacterized protein B0H18DRAFT_673635 [Fomitopsis serialis]|uniref:uncharacterized protein n=1 Tax=Fomitopsis serialis TaxID=139415 RepID=UPI002008C262|nr:uncharacterized protein B0H18DRAFT_673635 [Neoantrodia serialis]KAH9932991.1 hypothetical protein B0H18DRAFT_673635 [Neoantrodia serialis]
MVDSAVTSVTRLQLISIRTSRDQRTYVTIFSWKDPSNLTYVRLRPNLYPTSRPALHSRLASTCPVGGRLQPTTSVMPPDIPADLVYNILDYLWSDPWTLFNCALTCRTWRDASRRLLKRGQGLSINNFENLDRISRLLNSKKTRHFYRDLRQLYITDDREKPFMHVLSLRLPGALLPNVRLLRLEQIDWTSRRPHSSTFALTTAFTSVVDLSITGSRFGSSADIRQFISAFRELKTLELANVSVLSSAAGPRYLDLPRSARSPVKWLRLEVLRLDALPQGGTLVGHPMFLNPILDLCSNFTLLVMLHIRKCTFRSFDDLRHFVSCFPQLGQLKMFDIVWDIASPRRSTLPSILSEGPELPRLHTFVAKVASSVQGDRLLDWLVASLPNRSLESLDVNLCSTPLVGRTLRAVGGGLQRLVLHTVASKEGMATQTLYNYLGKADGLRIRICVQQDTPTLRLSRLALLRALAECDTIDGDMRRVDLHIITESQKFLTDDILASDASSRRKTAKDITSRPVFASLERVTVNVERYPSQTGTQRLSTLREARDEICGLLSDWDTRGILVFSYPSWYSENGHTVGGSVDAEEDIEDWAVWGDT